MLRSRSLAVAVLLLHKAAGFNGATLPQLSRPLSASNQRTSPLLLAKKKKGNKPRNKQQQPSDSSVPDVPVPLMVPDESVVEPPSTIDPPTAIGGLAAGWREVVSDEGELFYYNDATGISQWEVPEAAAPAPSPSFDAPAMPLPLAIMGTDDAAELPRSDGGLLPFGDGMPALKLPSFDEYSKGPSKPLPESNDAFQSKLKPINPGKSLYEQYGIEEPEETPFLEKWVFKLTWGGIFTLVFIEIFINTPVFQQIKPAILNFLGDGGLE